MENNTRQLINRILFAILLIIVFSCNPKPDKENKQKPRYHYLGWNILSSHRENGLKTLDKAAEYGINHIELSHYQLCHHLKDLRKIENRGATNFFIDEAHKRGIRDVFVWDHAFYEIDYYPDRFKVKSKDDEDFTYHTGKFTGGLYEKINLDDPDFWRWVYEDYDTLLSYVPDLDGIVLTFIETGSYVLYQHSEKLKSGGEKIAALIDSIGNYFIDRKGLKLTIRTFIYNQFEKDRILEALNLVKRKDITVMMKMVPHDWFMSYPYQENVEKIPFPVAIEYDCGMEYAGENIIINTFPEYFTDAFKYYDQFKNVVGFCARTDRYGETAAVGTPGELNLFLLSRLAENSNLSHHEITSEFINNTYGADALEYLKPAFDSAWNIIMASMYTLGLHTASHSRLNFHRFAIYQRHTTGEWYPPENQLRHVKHNVSKTFHNYRDILNRLSFPKYKTDTIGLKRDIGWVLDSAWLEPGEKMNMEFLDYIITEKKYAVRLAEDALVKVRKALPLISDPVKADNLFHTFNRTVLFTKERKAVAQAVYGYRLWSRGEEFQTDELQEMIWNGLIEGEGMLDSIDNYAAHTPKGAWNWTRDRESFTIYYDAITKTGWAEFGLKGVVVPKPDAFQ